jgi:hypothetical protein
MSEKMQKPIFSTREPKECLDASLAALVIYEVEIAKQSQPNNIYEIAWGTLALKNLGKDYKRLFNDVRSALSFLKEASPQEIEKFLYYYRRTVGAALSIYVFGMKELGFSEDRLHKICEALVNLSVESGIGELIGAALLLVEQLRKEDLKQMFLERLLGIINKLKDLCHNAPENYIGDLLYIAFFSAMAEDKTYREILEMIRKNESWNTYIENDPENMPLFLYILAKAAYSKSEDKMLIKWCKEKVGEIGGNLISFLNETRLVQFGNYIHIIDALLIAAEETKAYVQEKYPFIKEIRENEIAIDKKALAPFLPRLDLFAKAIISLNEAGYIRPYTLSKREADAYRQIRAELKNYRRIRKYELLFMMITSSIFLLLAPLMFLGVITFQVKVTEQILSFAVSLFIPIIAIIATIMRHIWKNGHISGQDLRDLPQKITNFLMTYIRDKLIQQQK